MWLYGLEIFAVSHHSHKFSENSFCDKSEPLTLGHQATNFGGFRHCDSGDETFLICHVISKDNVVKALHDFMGENPF